MKGKGPVYMKGVVFMKNCIRGDFCDLKTSLVNDKNK